jgi:hypothetical protein
MSEMTGAFHYRELFRSVIVARAVWATAHLKIADSLSQGPRTASDLAGELSLHAASLERLLRMLTGYGYFACDETGRFALTDMGALLRSDHPQSQRAYVDSIWGGSHYEAFACLAEAIRTGKSAFELRYGALVFDWLPQHPEEAALFAQAMSATTAALEDAVVAAHDFGAFTRLVDVGGSHGSLAVRLLEAQPRATGLILDLPDVIEAGRPTWSASAVADRIAGEGGNFFERVPAGGDFYVLKFILHDWPDDECVRILGNVRAAMAPQGRIAVIDNVLPEELAPHLGWTTDILMLAMTGGRERTAAEFDRLFADAGFERSRLTETPAGVGVVEALPV